VWPEVMRAATAPHPQANLSGAAFPSGNSPAASSYLKGTFGLGDLRTIELESAASDVEDGVDTAAEVANLQSGTASSLDLEKSHLIRKGREPSNQEILVYLAKHKLQELVTDVIMQVARHLPQNPFDFLLNHIESIVRRFCTAKGISLSSYGSGASFNSNKQAAEKLARVSSPDTGIVFTASRKQQDRILMHLAVVLRSADVSRSTAINLFERFASEGAIAADDFDKLLAHLRSSWGLQAQDTDMMQTSLKRWRMRTNAANGTQGLPLWPLSKADLCLSFPTLLRSVREQYSPARGLPMQRELFIREMSGDMREKYTVGPLLGHGSFGEVVLLVSKATKQHRVCKTVRWEQSKCPREDLSKEVEVLRTLDHPNIMRLFEFYQCEHFLQMIMEPIFGGSLASLVRELYQNEDGEPLNKRPTDLSEGWLAAVIGQLLGALTYAHDVVGIMHKDIKGENILLLGKPGATLQEKLSGQPHAVLIDFGLAEIFSERNGGAEVSADSEDGSPTRKRPVTKSMRSTKAGGTPPYMSPEMFRGSFSEKSDVWSLGVVMFQLMCGELPYRGGHLMLLVQNVCCPRRHPPWDRLIDYRWSAGARALCQKLLAKEEMHRPSAAEALQSHWLLRTPGATLGSSQSGLDQQAKTALQQVHMQSYMMRTSLQCLTSQLSLSELQHLSDQFKHYDTSGNGQLNHIEVTHALEDAGITSPEDVELIIAALDGDNSGTVEYSEFVSGCISVSSEDIRLHVQTVFNIFDLNSTGSISLAELRQVLASGTAGSNPPRGCKPPVLLLPDGKSVEEVMRELDTNGSGHIEYQEFETYLVAEHRKAADRRSPSKPR